uniref:Calcium release activated channel regulator 2A n=1 Tax=Naja naja TaxID=35670 RepID=A0A8C7E2Z9_NAJNA
MQLAPEGRTRSNGWKLIQERKGDSGSQLDVLAKAHEFFQICDVEGKGFIARHDMQRLHGELPLVPEELEKVFDTLDADGNGSLTLEEFTTGFSQFLSGRKEPFAEACETGFHPKPNESVAARKEEEEQFSNLMEQLGAENILKDENDVKKLWLHLKKHEPHLLSNFEEFLTKIFSQLHEADDEKNTLECALQNKMSAYDDEIQHLYEEMEQQIKTEKEKVVLEGAERFQSRQQELEQKLVEKEKEFEQLSQKQKILDKQCKELRNVKYDTTTENTKLRVTNQELLNSLERTSEELITAQQQLEILQDEAKKLQEEKEIEICRDEAFRTAPDRIFKIVLVGNSAVGKTSFLKQFCEERFYPGTAATVGVDYSMKTVSLDGSQVVLQLWDTAGQERYRSITKQFFRKADGVVVMYDVTAQETFVAVKQWLVSVEEAAGENIPVLLLGNKVDKEKERAVPKRLGEHLAKVYDEKINSNSSQSDGIPEKTVLVSSCSGVQCSIAVVLNLGDIAPQGAILFFRGAME